MSQTGRRAFPRLSVRLTIRFKHFCREKSVPEVLACYPEMKGKNDRGKEVIEFGNKYWVMVDETKHTHYYPEKTSRQ